ncbi:MAG: hypothetical protein L0H59_13900 [Tomitella sp.]|nr:hypothetical protein [Tomitella sp.]
MLAPLLVIFFAMAMEHIESRLGRQGTQHAGEAQRFIETHAPGAILAESQHAPAQ